jgi:NitT/TauT family transport system substrate-binding protein
MFLGAPALVAALLISACTAAPAATPTAAPSSPTPVVTAAPQPSPTAGEKLTVRALLPFVRGPAFFGQMLAEVLGYYDEEGLDVHWEPADGSSFVVQQVIAGNADVAVTITDNAMLGYAQSPTIKDFYNMNAESTGHLNDTWALASSGLTSMADLANVDGVKIGVKDLAGGEVPGLRVQLQKAGLAEADYEIVPLGEDPSVQAEALVSGDVNAFRVTFLSLVAVKQAVASQDEELICISCDETQLVSSLIMIASDSFIEQHPDALAGLGRATAKGVLFGTTNPDAAVALIQQAAPEQTDVELIKAQLAATIAQQVPGPPPADTEHYGYINADGLQETMDVLLVPDNPSGLSEAIDLADFYTNDFVDQFNSFDNQEIITAAQNWTP